MAARPKRSPEQIRRELELERDRLARAVDTLRREIGQAADVGGKLKAHLPVVAAGAAGTGFFLAGGVGATLRYLAGRRSKRRRR